MSIHVNIPSAYHVHPYRLILEPNHHPIPRNADGGIDTDRITAVFIVDVVDYH